MFNINDFINISPYSLNKKDKYEFLNTCLSQLTVHHYTNCENYKRIMDSIGFDVENIKSYYDIPFLPVRLFKEFDMLSIDRSEVFKTMTSSGTTGQKVSKIYLDRETSASQTKVLTKILSSYIGVKRLPMIILDTSAILKDRNMFSARGAGILGFSMFGYDKIYAFDEAMNLDVQGLLNFLEKHKGEDIFLFGFTFMIWQYFYNELKKLNIKMDLSKGIMIHGGGWKKLVDQAVTSSEFKHQLNTVCGIEKIYDYYGMVEQTGCIYMECEYGHLHASVFSDVIIRDFTTWEPVKNGNEGIIEVVSVLPFSYPGHALLTEDKGVLIGEDDCNCGRLGKYFRVTGRIPKAEIRGCSDTYAQDK